MRSSKNERSVIVVSHKVVHQPDDDLVYYLNNKNYANVLHITHSFANAPDRKSKYIWYKYNKIHKQQQTSDYKRFPEPFIYLKEIFYTFWWVWRTKIVWNTYIGFDGLCVLFGNILRSFSKTKKTIFWAIDFVPTNRFNDGLKNTIYHWINKNSYLNADEVWDLSPRMLEGRKQFLGIKKTDYKKQRIVPYGLWLSRITPVPYKNCEKNTIVFMGNLSKYQGLQLIISILPQLVKKYPMLKLRIIGEGEYTSTVKKLAKQLNISKYCEFLGRMKDTVEMEKLIAKSAVAVAPYLHEMDSISRYADPGKIKTYLACGVPVITTDVPWNAREIEKYNCGFIVAESEEDLKKKIILLFDSNRNAFFRKNSLAYAKSFDFENIFNPLVI